VDHIAFAIDLADFEPEQTRQERLGLDVSTAEHAWVHWRSLYINDPEGNTVERVCYDEAVRGTVPLAGSPVSRRNLTQALETLRSRRVGERPTRPKPVIHLGNPGSWPAPCSGRSRRTKNALPLRTRPARPGGWCRRSSLTNPSAQRSPRPPETMDRRRRRARVF
jgi:hypothetical protein